MDFCRNYSPVDDESARPLGFVASRFIYNSPTSHCVKVLNTAGKRIEVLVRDSYLVGFELLLSPLNNA